MNGENGGMGIMNIVILLVVFAGMYFFMLRPNAKRKKQEEEMRNNIQIGDEITTIGGLVGTVIGIKDDIEAFIIETGVDKSKIKVKKWAVASNNSAEVEIVKK